MEFVRNASFDDLIVNSSADVGDITSNDEPNPKDVVVQKADANSFDTLGSLMRELERRSLPVKGFFSDDVKTLQVALDKEYEELVQAKRKEALDTKITQAKEEAEQRRRDMISASIAEEEAMISKNPRISAWFHMIQDKSSPICCRIDDLCNVSVRSLSKLISLDNRLVSVDASHMNLSDVSGAYLGRALQTNCTLRTLTMGGNRFSSKTCCTLAESLLANPDSALSFLSLDSNPLCDGSKESIALFAKAISENKSLTTLSLWRCGLGINDGKLLAEAIVNGNSRLISLEVGYNKFDSSDVEAILKQLVRH